MPTIVKVVFKQGGKPYDFDVNDITLESGQKVVVETARGLEMGETVSGPIEIADQDNGRELKKVIRAATQSDLQRLEDNKKR